MNFGLSGSGGCPGSLGAPGGLQAASWAAASKIRFWMPVLNLSILYILDDVFAATGDVFAAVSDFGGIASEAFS